MLKIISENSDSEYPQKLFELGKVFNLIDDEIIETEKLSIAFTPGNFTDVNQSLDYLGNQLDIKLKIKESEKIDAHFIDGRVGEIFLDEKKIGTIGEIHPKILRNWKIKMPVSLFEIDLKDIFKKF